MSIVGNPLLLGGGKSSVFAFIVVTYPEGSTLTATKGGKVLTAGDTTGIWVFEIPEAGTWTVTSTLGGDTATVDVSIASKGQSEGIKLSYRVPSDYQEVEYIKGTGTQYVNLNKLITDFTKIEISYNYTPTSGDKLIVGSRNLALGILANGNAFASNSSSSVTGGNVSGKHHIIWNLQGGNSLSYSLDNGTSVGLNIQKNTIYDSNVYLFSTSIGSSVAISAEISNAIFWNGDTKILDLVPCYRKSNNVAGLWDAVGKQFYTNAGTGTFIVGDPV